MQNTEYRIDLHPNFAYMFEMNPEGLDPSIELLQHLRLLAVLGGMAAPATASTSSALDRQSSVVLFPLAAALHFVHRPGLPTGTCPGSGSL